MRQSILFPRVRFVKPTVFEEYFGIGKEEEASPFLTPNARKWAINLTLRAAFIAAFFLLIAFTLSFTGYTFLAYFLLVFVYFLAGVPSLIEAVEDLAVFDVNIDVLMTLAAFSSVLIGSGFEGALLLVLFSVSGAIEDSVTLKAKGSLNFLQKLSPSKATVIGPNGLLLERSVKDVTLGTIILIRAGEIVPLDGIVIDGISSLNLAHLTGESLPIIKKIGDEVPSGARNMEGALTLKVTHTMADSTIARIIQLVTQAQESKPQLQRWFDKFSRSYALSIIGLSTLFALTLPFLFAIPFLGFEGSVYRALAFLIAASPCALILALPIAYLSAVSACARNGILLKGGIVLDGLANSSIIAFDKTGTLTTGELTCKSVHQVGADKCNENEIIALAYSLERNTVHPIAKAISTLTHQKNLSALPIKDFKFIAGYGVEGFVEWNGSSQYIYMGHSDYIQNKLTAHQLMELKKETSLIHQSGRILSVLYVGDSLFIFSFEDALRPYAKETIHRLKQIGCWRLLMLTGDHETNARQVATELGMDEYYANLKPENKLQFVTNLSQNDNLVMVGDGVNDAPALARATVGICMGKVGSGTAIDAAEVVLLQDNLEKLDWLMQKALQNRTIIRQNLAIAISAIFIASIPALAGMIPLWLAVCMHEGGTVLVGLNALRLLK